MSESFDSLTAKALLATGAYREAIVTAAKIMATTKWGDEAWHEAHSIVFKAFEAGLREWVRANPPGQANYTVETPMRAVWSYRDTLLPGLAAKDALDSIVVSGNFSKVVTQVLRSQKNAGKAAGKAREKDLVAQRHPEYPALLKEIQQAKKDWKEDDKRIKGTHEFRMMGGLARMGTSASARYRDLVERAQRFERNVLGRPVTEYKRVKG